MSISNEERNEWGKQDRLLLAIEKPFMGAVIREKNRFIRQQAERLDPFLPVNEIDVNDHRRNMRTIFERYYRLTIRSMSNHILKNTTTKADGYVLEKKQDLWEFLFREWVTIRGAEAALTTANTTKDDIKRVILSAQASDVAVPRNKLISDMLKVRGISAFRANTIARTETGMAASYASKKTAQDIASTTGDELMKKWVPALDERTRFSHASMASKKAIGMDTSFVVNGEKMDRPKDPNGSASNVINCRCVLTYKRKGSLF